MDAERWDRLQTIFFSALDLPADRRHTFIADACAGDTALRREVEAVLAAHVSVDGPDLLPGAVTGAVAGEAGDLSGCRIGPYRLDERIGQGGMGEVYRAQRVDDQYRQEVAIKLVRSSLPADEMARRFRVERQVLARLQHPNVATLLDGGVTEDGRPYLVMQYVDGSPVTEYSDSKALPIAERLRIFGTICRAVHFAHSNLVVHRDLKPSNIIVGTDGQVRLLDFGIAKLLDPEGMGITAPLTQEMLLLTPEHAAPEQVLGEPITTATDVYALGVLLYELLTGTRPFRATPGGAWLRAVCEGEPVPPSAVLAATGATGTDGAAGAAGATGTDGADKRVDVQTVSAHRSTRPAALQQALRGDLDHIVLKALRKEPAQRYASAEQFAEDIDRYLSGTPVRARRDTFAYRSRKFLRRNRVPVAAAAVALLMLVGATVVTAQQSRARADALEEAQLERDKAKSLAAFMLGVFQASDPAVAGGSSITARELLDQAAARVDGLLEEDPLVRAEMKLAIGRSLGALGHYEAAYPLFADVLRLRRERLRGDNIDVAESLDQLGRGLAALGRLDEAIPLMREALGMRERVLGPNDTLVASTLTFLGRMEIEQSEYALARSRLERAVAIHRQQPVPGRGFANSLRFLWLALYWLGEKDDELPIAREALAVAQATMMADDPLLLNVMQDYALALESAEQFDSAAAVTRSVLESQSRVLGPDHPAVSYAYHNLGRVLKKQGSLAEALDAYRAGLEIRERALGPTHPAVTHILHSYAVALADAGEVSRAVELEERAIPIMETQFGERHLSTLDALEFVAQLYAIEGRDEQALSTLEGLVSRGWTNHAVLERSPFQHLADGPRFQRILHTIRDTTSTS